MSEAGSVFVFMDTLPTVSECVQCIIKVAPSYGYHAQKNTIKRFADQLEILWIKAFSSEHVKSHSAIYKQLDKHMLNYRNEVQKKKGNQRQNFKQWKLKNSYLFDLIKPTSNPDTFDDDEKHFYYDQKTGTRRMGIGKEVDEDYEPPVEVQGEESSDENDDEPMESGPPLVNSIDIVQSKLRSGKTRTTKVLIDRGTQTIQEDINVTPIRKSKCFRPEVKAAIATTSSRAGITTEQARRAFQATCEVFLKQKYYLSVDEIPCETSDEISCETSDDLPSPPPSKRPRPRTKEDYKKYELVLPTAKVINSEKHFQAIQNEKNCALAMMDSEEDICMQYDTTQRRRIKGDWTSLIVKIKNGQTFRLRPLSLAVENRQTICDLMVEELTRLAKAGNIDAKTLWEKICALMTDSVPKNLHIEDLIAATLNSNHIPFHLLCVSHTCEVFDRGNMAILKELEMKIKLREAVIARMPALKSFLTNKSVTVAALEALNKLVINDGHKSSQWEMFDKILQDKGKTKKHSQYLERRFAKLGYSAATVVYHLEDYEDLLHDVKSNNQLVQACRVYLQCEFVIIGLKVLSWFTSAVTLPFLNMVEKSKQSDLLKILPELHKDLKERKTDTLNEFMVKYSFDLGTPTSALEKHILGLFCERAAADLATQRGREYGFGDVQTGAERATALDKLDPERLDFLPTNNLACERDLAVFDKLAKRSASCSNRKFTSKGIQD